MIWNGILLTAVVGGLLLPPPPLFSAQQAEWDRLMTDGNAATVRKEYALAEVSYRHALQYAEVHWKKDARLSANLLVLAEACNAQGKKDEAEVLANRTVSALSDALKEYKPKDASEEMEQVETSATVFTRVGDLFSANEKYSDAEVMYQKLIAIRQEYAHKNFPSNPSNEDFYRFTAQTLGHADAKIADADDKLGTLYLRERKFEQAKNQFKQSELIREKAFGPDQPIVAQSRSDIARCYALEGQYEQAKPLYERVIAILERSDSREKSEMAVTLENYSLLLRRMGRESDAKAAADRAIDIRNKLSANPDTTH